MKKKMKIIVDAMGGDNAPDAIVSGCIDALMESNDYHICLVGHSPTIEKIVSQKKFSSSNLEIVHAEQVITNNEMPTKAIKKKQSSMIVGLKKLESNEGDLFLSAGNTGALMAGALFTLGRMPGVDRPALVATLPGANGPVLLLDSGANTSCKPLNYLQFGIMGSIYMKNRFNIDNPKIGLINVGSEPKKGTELIRHAFNALRESEINFLGNIEGSDILNGNVDVAVCDGFLGNVLLKFLEGAGVYVFNGLKDVYSKGILSKLSALIVKNKIKKFQRSLDYTEFGGAPLLGVNKLVIKTHGKSNAYAVKKVLLNAKIFIESSILDQLRAQFENLENIGG